MRKTLRLSFFLKKRKRKKNKKGRIENSWDFIYSKRENVVCLYVNERKIGNIHIDSDALPYNIKKQTFEQ